MCLLKSFYCLIIIFKCYELRSEFFTTLIKLFSYFLEVVSQILCFFFILSFELSLLFFHGLLVYIKLFLSVFPFFKMVSLKFLNFIFQITVIFSLFDLILLFKDYFIGFFKNLLHFFFMAVCKWCLINTVFLVFGMKVEDYLGKLGNLLRHLVVSLFCRTRCCIWHLCKIWKNNKTNN